MTDIASSELHAVLKAALLKQKYIQFTDVQSQVIPLICSNKASVLALAPTGSGKTIAYVAPLLDALIKDPSRKFVIVLPTRDLAFQVHEIVKIYCEGLGFSSAALVGGIPVSKDYLALKKNPSFVIGTPGRMHFHLQALKKLSADTLVFDEVDRLLDSGFKKEYKALSDAHAHSRKIFFSATMPVQLKEIIASKSDSKLQVVDIVKLNHQKDSIAEEFIDVQSVEEKFSILKQRLKTVNSTVVFVNSKRAAKLLSGFICKNGHKAVVYSSNRSINQRRKILADFSSGQIDVIVATDIASRGLDFKDLDLVVNYQVPFVPSDYVHRIGRTGRASSSGRAITLISKAQLKYAKNIDTFKTTNKQILEPRPFRKSVHRIHRNFTRRPKKH